MDIGKVDPSQSTKLSQLESQTKLWSYYDMKRSHVMYFASKVLEAPSLEILRIKKADLHFTSFFFLLKGYSE